MSVERLAERFGATNAVLMEVREERARQDAKWGERNHRDGTGGRGSVTQAQALRKLCDERFRVGTGAWSDILMEEVGEAFAEDDGGRLRAELIQVSAVAVGWIEAIDRRVSRSTSPVAAGETGPEEQRRQGAGGDGKAATPGLSVASTRASRLGVSGLEGGK